MRAVGLLSNTILRYIVIQLAAVYVYMDSFRSLCSALEKAEGRKRLVVVCHFANGKLIIVERVYILKSRNDTNVNEFLIPLLSAQVLQCYRSYFFCETAARRQ